ncbi:hypothetical protein RJ55_03124 [Drechmeria coniospora]|nr:hypothetical protein RJ55_03124 [Drechmeria coniospora]
MPSTHIPADTWTELTKVTGEPFVTLYVTHPNVGQCRYKKVEPGNKTDEKDLRQPEDSFRFVGAGSLNVWSPVATEINWRV